MIQNYLNNNLILIKTYEDLYKDGIDIKNIIEKFKADNLAIYDAYTYGRFRVFIDSCLLLLNKEELEILCRKNYTYKDFYEEMECSKEIKYYFNSIKSVYKWIKCNGMHLYSSLEGKSKNPWEETKTIRNAMAHMQYGNFQFDESGHLVCYYLYNKDKKSREDSGVVFEPIVHDFIQRYFSNYSYGVLYHDTFFLKYSIKKKRKVLLPIFYHITCRDEVFSPSVISDIVHIQKNVNVLLEVLDSYKDKLLIKELPIYQIPDISRYNKLVWKNKSFNKNEYFWGLKSLLDFKTELSNFLVHIGRLNDILYQYQVLCNSALSSSEDIRAYKKRFEKLLWELREDEHATLIFKIGFMYLRAMNLALRSEDDDYEKLNLKLMDVSMFNYSKIDYQKYIEKNDLKEEQLQSYVMERMRNALMHGHVNIRLDKKGDIIFIFNDIYNKRNEKVEINFNRMKEFYAQECLYSNIPKNVTIMYGKPR